MESDLKSKLRAEVRVSDWMKLGDFANRDAIIVISEELDLLEVAESVVRDDKEIVASWVDEQLVTKPNDFQLRLWSHSPTRPFRCLIVYPYVLVQTVAS